MSQRPSLHDFVDDELLRAPMTFDQVVDTVLTERRLRAETPTDRTLQQQRGSLVTAALRSLRLSCMAELQRIGGAAAADAQAAPAVCASPPAQPAQPRELSLIGEDDITVDIEIARCIAAIRLCAEAELRELQTYTSALVDDPNMSRDTNPLRPEVVVRALRDAVATLPLPRGAVATLLRDAAQPLALAMRRSYAAASARLDGQGVTPAAYRTIVTPGTTVWGHDVSRHQPPERLNALRDSLPPAVSTAEAPARPPPAARPARAPSAAAAPGAPTAGEPAKPPSPAAPPLADPQSIELLSRLFDAIQNLRGLPADVVALLQRLQPSALRVALNDPELLDSYDHAVWRFMDLMSFQLSVCSPSGRIRLLGMLRNLVDRVAGAEGRGGSRFDWAIEWLGAHHRHALARSLVAAEGEIDRLQRAMRDEAHASTAALPLDMASLDTVPAELLDSVGTSSAQRGTAAAASLPRQPGDYFRVYLQGDWRLLQLLWQDNRQGLWLMLEPAAERHWALHDQAIDRLHHEGLAHPLRVRSLVRRAAAAVLRGL